jgi:hypothetical protein
MDFLQGVIHGKFIELDNESGYPDGQRVSLVLQPSNSGSEKEKLPSGEGLRRSFGSWADNAAELDAYLDWNRRQRKITRPEIQP